jgi:hypothetical protein
MLVEFADRDHTGEKMANELDLSSVVNDPLITLLNEADGIHHIDYQQFIQSVAQRLRVSRSSETEGPEVENKLSSCTR